MPIKSLHLLFGLITNLFQSLKFFKNMKPLLFVYAFLTTFSTSIAAQTKSNIAASLMGKALSLPQEKVYLSFDKPFYAVGETMWFKAFLADATTHETDTISAVLYVDFIEEASNRLIAQQKLKISESSAFGSFPTEGSKSGRLLVRAYTNWMRNVPADFHFNTVIQLLDVNKSSNITPSKPVINNLQFFPEGGNLVDGLPCNVAFKATDDVGKGIAIKGIITDETGATVATLTDDFNGMGRFTFKPEIGKKYGAKVETSSKTFDLPQVLPNGLSLTIDNSKVDMPIRLFAYLNYTPEKMPNSFTILAHQRGKVGFANQVLVKDKATFKTFKGTIPRTNFEEEGIVTITIFDDAGMPIAERLVFVAHKKRQLTVNVKTNKTTYNKREQVTVDVETTDAEGKATAANISFGVLNSDKIGTPQYAEDLRSYLLLRSDLKGTIEYPAFYFEDTTAKSRRGLDNLLMTQGWRRFVWSEILTKSLDSVAFLPDFGLTATGVATKNKKPMSEVSLLVSVINKTEGNRFHYTKTDKNGRFLLNNLSFTDTTTLKVKTANLSKDYTIDFPKEKNTPSVIADLAKQIETKMLFANAPTDNIKAYLDAAKLDLEGEKSRVERSIDLDAVEIKAKKKEKFDPRVIYTAEKTYEIKDGDTYGGIMFDWLRLEANLDIIETADGDIFFKPFRGSLRQGKPLLVIDGSPTNDLQMLRAIFVNEVERVDINRIGTGGFFDPTEGAEGMIHIMTKAGNPDYYKNRKTDETSTIPSTVLMGYSIAKQFYIPNYDDKKPAHQQPDHRSSIYWSPMIKTDKTGKTTVSFFTTDDAATMRILVEGLDKTGKIGVGQGVFKTN